MRIFSQHRARVDAYAHPSRAILILLGRPGVAGAEGCAGIARHPDPVRPFRVRPHHGFVLSTQHRAAYSASGVSHYPLSFPTPKSTREGDAPTTKPFLAAGVVPARMDVVPILC